MIRYIIYLINLDLQIQFLVLNRFLSKAFVNNFKQEKEHKYSKILVNSFKIKFNGYVYIRTHLFGGLRA